MKVKKLFQANSLPQYFVIETLNGDYMKFLSVPFRIIEEKELMPVPYYQAKGENAVEASPNMYLFYGLEKI